MKKLRSNVRITELDTTSDTLVRLYAADSTVASDEYLHEVMAEIEELSARITTAIKSDRIASTLETADTRRDEGIRSLGTLLNGYAVFPAEDRKAAAERLLTTFGKYKGITAESYANKSSLIESMLEDFSVEGMSEAVNALDGVSSLLTNIRDAQNAFIRANDEFTIANATRSESASAIKKPLLSAINDKLVPYLTAMALANAAVYGDFSTKAAAEIERVNIAVAKRRRQSSPEPTEPTA